MSRYTKDIDGAHRELREEARNLGYRSAKEMLQAEKERHKIIRDKQQSQV